MTPGNNDPSPLSPTHPRRLADRLPCCDDIRTAHAGLRGIVGPTPCTRARELSALAGADVWLKREYTLPTGSFKERGAAHALACLDAAARARGVVAASAGNHALGLARHGARLGVPVTLVMPRTAPRVKRERCLALGARVVLAGDSFDEAEVAARELALRERCDYVHPFDDARVIAGQGTIGLEILAQVPDVATVIVPVGGGGLLAGVALAVKSLRPRTRVVAVEPAAAASFSGACACGHVVRVPVARTFADGLAVARVGELPFARARRLVDLVVTVSEQEIATAMLCLFESERITAEGAGATALAALLAGKLDGFVGDGPVVLPVCGANVDAATFVAALQQALAARAAAQPEGASGQPAAQTASRIV